MQKLVFALCLLFVCGTAAWPQPLVLQGRVRCLNQPNTTSTSGLVNVLVVPGFLPSKSTLTASNPQGYFEINTAIDARRLEGKTVKLYLISKCDACNKKPYALFVSADQMRSRQGAALKYLPVERWMVNAVCRDAELQPLTVDSMLNVVVQQPAENVDQLLAGGAVVAPASFLNLLTKLTTVAVGQNQGTFLADTLLEGDVSYGIFLFSSALVHTSNTGFNFSPHRNFSEAVFWNAAAMANSPDSNHFSAFTNLKNNARLAAFSRITNQLYVGGGALYTRQDEFRKTIFQKIEAFGGDRTDSPLLRLEEYGFFVSAAVRATPQLSIGLTAKSLHQKFTIPDTLLVTTSGSNDVPDFPDHPYNLFIDDTINRSRFDLDLSFTYQLHPAVQVGLSLMNLFGSELYSDAFVPRRTNIRVPFSDSIKFRKQRVELQNQRSLGVGVTYKWRRLNLGVDALFTQDGFYDAAIGANFIPANNVLLYGGVTIKQQAFTLGVQLKHFRIAYIHDDGLLVNERREGKSGFLNGRIHSGVVFGF